MEISNMFPTVVKMIFRIIAFGLIFYLVLNVVVWHFHNAKLLGISKMVQRNVRVNGFISNRDLEAMQRYIKQQYPLNDDEDYDPLNDQVVGLSGVVRNVKIVELKEGCDGTHKEDYEEIKKNSTTVNRRVNRGTLKVVGVQFEYHWLNPLNGLRENSTNVLTAIEPKFQGEDLVNGTSIIQSNNTVAEDFWFRDVEESREELKENYNFFSWTDQMVNPVITEKFYADLPRVNG